MDEGEFVAEHEAAQVISLSDDGDDSAAMADDDDEDLAAAAAEEEANLSAEERAAREAQLHRAGQMATDLRQMLDEDDSKQGFFEHKSSVYCVALSRDGQLALSGDGDDQAYLWDASSGAKLLHLTGHTDSVIDAAFSADGRYMATASMDATARVWNPDGSLHRVLEGPAQELEWMAWHPAGNVLAAGSADETVWMWNAESGECMTVFSGHSGSVTCGGWSADGKSLVTCDASGGLIVWNPKTGEAAIHVKDLHEGAITSFALHPDRSQKLCISGGHDGAVKILSLDTGKTLTHYKSLHSDSVEGVAFAEKLKLAASCSVDGKLKVLDLTNGQVRVTCAHDDAVTRIEWAPTGEPLIYSSSVDKTLKLWDARSGQCLQTWKGHSDAVLTFAVSGDGGTLLSGADDHTALVFKR